LDAAGEFLLTVQPNDCVLLGNLGVGVAADMLRFDAAATDLLTPRGVGSAEGVRSETRKVGALDSGSLFKRLPNA
jgi:hypothetical protein